MDPTMIGSYGEWAASHLPAKHGALSLLSVKGAPGPSRLAAWRKAARQKVCELLCLQPVTSKPAVRLLRTFEQDGLAIEEISWQLPSGPETAARFLKPAGESRRLPGILAFHDHGGNKYFGLRKITRGSGATHPLMVRHQEQYYGGRAWANELARRGYAVLVHDVFPFASRRVRAADLPAHVVQRMMAPRTAVRELSPEDVAAREAEQSYEVGPDEPEDQVARYNAFAAAHEDLAAKALFSAGLTWPGTFVAEDMAALDYLASRDDVDPSRLGCGGLSGGGLRTDYLAGLDDRIRCSVTAGFMTTWRDLCLHTCYTHTWMVYIPGLPALLDFPELLGLRVPLPALVLQTNQDPLFTLSEARRAGDTLRDVYATANAAERFRMSFYDGPHKFDVPMQEEAFAWFDTWLR